jgi:hypothetical protein
MEPVTSNINDLKFTFNGKAFGLHHSNADLTPGKDRILASGALSAGQTTAGDTTKGFSYFWDAANIDSVSSSVHNQANAKNIYLVEAASAGDVLPDINVPGSSARAIKGDMSILDKISLPTDIGNGREARISVLEMLKKHGIIPETKAGGQLIDDAYFLNRGERALAEYIPARAQMQVDAQAEFVQQIDPRTGMIKPVYAEGGRAHDLYLSSLTESGRKGMLDKKIAEGEKVLTHAQAKTFNRARAGGFMSPANNNISLSEINIDSLNEYENLEKAHRASVSNFAMDALDDSPKQKIQARISANRSRLAAQESTGKGFKKAMGSSSLLEAAEDASKAVVRRDSVGMKLAGAAATILRRRI